MSGVTVEGWTRNEYIRVSIRLASTVDIMQENRWR